MIIEFQGKEYESTGWHKPILERLLSKRLKDVQLEKARLRIEENPIEYTNRIVELIREEQDIKYKLDQLSGIPML